MLQEVLDRATFKAARLVGPDTIHHDTYTSVELCDMLASLPSDEPFPLMYPEPRLPEELEVEFLNLLRGFLSNYIADDRIYASRPPFVSIGASVDVRQIAIESIWNACRIGIEPSAQLLYEWGNYGKISYYICAILSGVTIERPLDMGRGIHFELLPSSTRVFSRSNGLGSSIAEFLPERLETVGTLLVTIECDARPALYRPEEDRAEPKRTWTYGPIPERLLDSLCEALSLACNSYVTWTFRWQHCPIEPGNHKGVIWDIALGSARGSRSAQKPMSKSHMEQAHDLLVNRIAKGNDGSRPKLELAIKRWMGSKSNTDLEDKHIELRIALEALYLPDIRNELRFNLATRAAWHLGADFDERREYQKILRRAYDLGSKAVHASGIEYSEKTSKLLSDAQDLCRKGILKRLDETVEPNWNELILGKELEAEP